MPNASAFFSLRRHFLCSMTCSSCGLGVIYGLPANHTRRMVRSGEDSQLFSTKPGTSPPAAWQEHHNVLMPLPVGQRIAPQVKYAFCGRVWTCCNFFCFNSFKQMQMSKKYLGN